MDLNLLRVFVAVYETGTVTAAAERLFVTQSAISQSLTRLRHELDDQLFAREGRSMQPTPAADELYPKFHSALGQVEAAIAELRDFDPLRSRHRFRVALSELGEVGFLPAILRRIAQSAPRVSVEVVPLDVAALPEWLMRGRVDLAVSSTPPAGDFDGPVLKSEHYMVLMSRTHPLASRGALSRDELSRARHISASSDSAAPGVSVELERAGVHLVPEIIVSHTSALPGLLDAGPWVTIVPASLADNWMQSWPLSALPLPVTIPPISVRLYSRSTSRDSAALAWFRTAVTAAAQSAPRQFWSPPARLGSRSRGSRVPHVPQGPR